MCARVLCGGCGGSRPIAAGSQGVRRRRSRLAPLRPFALCPRRATSPHPPPAPPMPPRLARRTASSLSPVCPLAARAEWSACVLACCAAAVVALDRLLPARRECVAAARVSPHSAPPPSAHATAAPAHPPPAPPMPPRPARRTASSLPPFCPLAEGAEWSACVLCGGCGSGATTRTSAPDDALDCRHRSHASRIGSFSSNWNFLVNARHCAELRAVNGCTAALWTWMDSSYFELCGRTPHTRDRTTRCRDPKVEIAR